MVCTGILLPVLIMSGTYRPVHSTIAAQGHREAGSSIYRSISLLILDLGLTFSAPMKMMSSKKFFVMSFLAGEGRSGASGRASSAGAVPG